MTTATSQASVIVAPQVSADIRQHLLDSYPADAARIDRAVELVQRGHVERVAGRPSHWLVRSASRPNLAHHVSAQGCSCEDYSKRGGHCMHQFAVELFCYAERAELDASNPTLSDEPIGYELTELAFELLGEVPALAPQCRRCQSAASLATHDDGLCRLCVLEELYGDDPHDGVA